MKKEIIFSLFFILVVLISGCSQQQEINSFEECVAAGNPVMESYPRQCMANGKTFVEELSEDEKLMLNCGNAGGIWIAEVLECEGISEEDCIKLGGTFDECASACRNDPTAEICTLQCVQVCSFIKDLDMTLSEAIEIAKDSDCADTGELTKDVMYNAYTKTWWIGLDPFEEKPGCNPACVINVETGDAGINWRCTGAIPP
ncbi:MAG: hypothetical protein JSW73_01560 [Candidatus Woesearchaeota archaeon]|nr:MAG: hypothetical protein JSW73_01560 [Candidatus Woesearchaeota archaeon]